MDAQTFKFLRFFHPHRLPAPHPFSTCLQAARYDQPPDVPVHQCIGHHPLPNRTRTAHLFYVLCLMHRTHNLIHATVPYLLSSRTGGAQQQKCLNVRGAEDGVSLADLS
jgi:hypothetical protein